MKDWRNPASRAEKQQKIDEKWGGEPPRYLWFAVCNPGFPAKLAPADIAALRSIFFGGKQPAAGAIEFGLYNEPSNGVYGDLRIRGFEGPVTFALTLRGQDLPLMRVANDTNTEYVDFHAR